MKKIPKQELAVVAKQTLTTSIDAVDRLSEKISPKQEDPLATPEGLARPTILFGMWSIILLFGFFGLWSILAPIDSAAIATGSVVLDSNRKKIQHLEGGIVEEILVKEGDTVEEGQVLVRLDETAAQARLDLLVSQSVAARAAEARLKAERDNDAEIDFPEDLIAKRDASTVVEENLDSQHRIFDSRRKDLEGKIAVLKQKIEQLKEEIKGLESQEQSATTQIGKLSEQIRDVRKLVEQGNARKPRLLELEGRLAAVKGERGKIQSDIARANQSIGEAEITIINTRNDFLKEVVAELKDTQVQIADLEERMRASADTVSRIEIKAPLAGEITGLKVHTKGGVIAPGEVIMDIVPTDDKLIVEAQIRPEDIDVVRPGLTARVQLRAYRARFVPPVEGNVNHVSADRFTDERSGMPFYMARIEIPPQQLAELENVELYPGMPTDVLIVTGSRTFLKYLMDPITDSFNHAFREE